MKRSFSPPSYAPILLAALVGCAFELPPEDEFLDTRCEWWIPLTDAQRDFPIAAVLPMTGQIGKPDDDALARTRAMQLAIEGANERQGIGGRKFGFRVCNKGFGWVSGGAIKAAHIGRWLADQGTQTIITGGSNDTLAIHAATSAKKSLIMSLGATAADITHLTDSDLVWRVAPSDLYQGVVMAKVLADQGAKNVAVVAIDNAYGESLGKVLKDNAGAMTVKVYPARRSLSDAAPLLQLIVDQAPDFLVFATDPSVAKKVLDTMNAKGSLANVPLLLSDALHKKEFLTSLDNPNRLHGAFGTLPGDPVGPTFDSFATHFSLRFSDDATQRSFTAHSYDAAYTLILAHAWALRDDANKAVTADDLADGLKQLSDHSGATYSLEPTNYVAATSELLAGKPINVEGASGALDFDPVSGEPTSAVELWQVEKDLSFKTIKWWRAKQVGDAWTYEEILPK